MVELNFGTDGILPGVSWNAELKKVSWELHQVWPQWISSACWRKTSTYWRKTSACWRMDIWNLVAFSVPSLLFFPLRRVASQNKTDMLWQTSGASEDLWYTTVFQEGAVAKSLFALIAWLSGRREVFMHQLMKSDKTQNLSRPQMRSSYLCL